MGYIDVMDDVDPVDEGTESIPSMRLSLILHPVHQIPFSPLT